MLPLCIMEQSNTISISKGLMDVSALPWIIHRPFRHEGGDQTAFVKKRLGEGFKEGRLVCRF